jgi:hypothetical protein
MDSFSVLKLKEEKQLPFVGKHLSDDYRKIQQKIF